jgi:polar amino acid transport system permease protein
MGEFFEEWLSYLPDLLQGLELSIEVTILSLAIGIPCGLVLAVLVSSSSRLAKGTALLIVEFGRGAPALVLLQLVYFGLPTTGLLLSSFVSAIAALAWNTAAYTSEIIRAGLEAVPFGQREAATAIGLNPLDALRFVLVPQGLRMAIPALMGFSIQIFQATSLCFTIALPELLSRSYGIGSQTFHYFDVLLLAALIYAAICIPASVLMKRFEHAIGHYAT